MAAHTAAHTAITENRTWFTIFGILLIVLVGLAQRVGWIGAGEGAPAAAAASDAKVPMLQVASTAATEDLRVVAADLVAADQHRHGRHPAGHDHGERDAPVAGEPQRELSGCLLLGLGHDPGRGCGHQPWWPPRFVERVGGVDHEGILRCGGRRGR